MDKRSQQKQTRDIPKQTRDIPTSKTSRLKGFDAQQSSLQAKDAEPSRPQNKPEAARASTLNPKDLKQTRDIPTSKTSRPKNFHAQLSSLQAKDAGPSRPQNKPEAARASTSNSKDLTSKSSKHSASRHHNAIQPGNQTVWEKQQRRDHGASNSRQRQNPSAQLGWRQAMPRRSSSMSSLDGRSFNPSLRRKLAGGGEGDETSNQQPEQEYARVYGHDASGTPYARSEKVDREPQDRSAIPDSVSNDELLAQSVDANAGSHIGSYNNRNS